MIKENKIQLNLGNNIYKVGNKKDLIKFIGVLINDLKSSLEAWVNFKC